MRTGMVVTSWGRPCGVGEYGRALVQALRSAGCPVTVLTEEPAQAAARARALGLDLVHFQYEYNLYDARELAEALAALAGGGAAVLVTVHSWVPGASYANEWLRRSVAGFVVPLPAIRLGMMRAGIPGERVTVIPLGIPRHRLPPRAAVRAALGLGGEPAVGFFGFCHRHKGMERLALAARLLRARHPGLRLFLFASAAPNEGSRAARARLREFLDAHGLWEGVSWEERYLPEEEAVARLHAMDVNVLPYAELEGVQASAAARTVLAAARPTVVTDTAHFADLGEAVHRVPDDAPERLAAAVAYLLESPGAAARLVAAASRLADRWSWEQVAAAHLRCYARALAAPAAPAAGVTRPPAAP